MKTKFKLLLFVLMESLLIAMVPGNANAVTPSNLPLFLTQAATPPVMLNMSKDHQLYFKAFDDYSDLDKDGIPETTYKHSIDYYGYFDSYKCYDYDDTNGYFKPVQITSDKYCPLNAGNGQYWSGNFLNWASMSRIDIIRKILYGGMRSTDQGQTTTTSTTSSSSESSASLGAYDSGVDTGPVETLFSSSSITGDCTASDTTTAYSDFSNDTPPVTSTSGYPLLSDESAAFNQSTVTNGNTTTSTYQTTQIKTISVTTYTKTSTATRTKITCSPKKKRVYTETITRTFTAYTTSTVTNTYTTVTSPVYGTTVLERSYIPTDAHSFAKYYAGSDLVNLTPFTSANVASGITLCNTSYDGSSVYSQSSTASPLIRVAKGNFSLWAANERWQCTWDTEHGDNANSNNSALSGISANSSDPSRSSDGLGEDDYVARVKVCDSALLGKESCKLYPAGSYKPIGLLQSYGDGDQLYFGLMTGSYAKNKSGGVLRKNISSFTSEVNYSTDGTFKHAGGIVDTIDSLIMSGYSHGDGTYNSGTAACSWGLTSFTDGKCVNWGNPQSEIYLESLRYFAGKAPAFSANDSPYLAGVTEQAWQDPLSSAQWCARPSILQFNASTSSYDGDQLTNATDVSATNNGATETNAVGTGEGMVATQQYFIGSNGTINNGSCDAKSYTGLSSMLGTCPDAPGLSGVYNIAGLSAYAYLNPIRTNLIPSNGNNPTGKNMPVRLHGVALSPKVPKVEINVPGTNKTITIMPSCQNTSVGSTHCAIADFKIVTQFTSGSGTTLANEGTLYVNWEDSQQGGDFDQDMWGVLKYKVTSSQVSITTDAIAQSTGYSMAFGYIISGTTKDGFHAHSGINSYGYADPTSVTGCGSCAVGDGSTTVTYTVGSGSALSLKQPLWYASKWGGFKDSNGNSKPDLTTEWDVNGDSDPDNYYAATNPAELFTALNATFSNIINTAASSSSAAANSTNIQTNTLLYQAKFSSNDWSGNLFAYPVQTGGTLGSQYWDASTLIPSASSRTILTYNGSNGVAFDSSGCSAQTSSTISSAEALSLNTNKYGIVDNQCANRISWISGNTVPGMRSRTNVLGDIVNSDPIFSYNEDFGYSSLPAATGAEKTSYAGYVSGKATRAPMIYVGANDGMLHAFRADTGNSQSGVEQFAYVPADNFTNHKLSNLTDLNYTHEYYVDGTVTISDAYLSGSWKTILVGGLNFGGKSIYALDISNPTSMNAGKVLWEYSDANDLGYTYSQPQIVRLNDGNWYAIFGNGYNSSNNSSYLYLVDLSSGIAQKISAGVAGSWTTSTGLSTPVTYDSNGDKIVDYVYAGDLQGNLWKFDLSSASSSGWGLGNSGNPLFIAKDSFGNTQPISTKPTLGGNTQTGSGVLIYVGTGIYLQTSDITNTSKQTFYTVWDNFSTASITTRSQLQEQTVLYTGAVNGISARSTSANSVDYTSVKGWYMDLPLSGERVISPAKLVNKGGVDRVLFITTIPSSDACNPNGTSWLMEMASQTGAVPSSIVFDLNNSGTFTSADNITSGSNNYVVSGMQSTVGQVKSVVWLDSPTSNVSVKEMPGTTGNVVQVNNLGDTPVSGSAKRVYWQQIQ